MQPGQQVQILNKQLNNQVRNVLRMRQGDRLALLDGSGALFDCIVTKLEGRTFECRVESRQAATGDAQARVSVALPVLKGDRFEWALQKMTELGVWQVVPLITARSVVKVDTAHDAKSAAGKVVRWQAILREAAEQCERATIPHLVAISKFDRFISELDLGGTGDTAYICAERLQTDPLRDIFLPFACQKKKMLGTADKTIHLIIGPEGGFTSEELQLAQNAGVKPVSLGQRILRAETAAVFSLAQVIWCLEN